MPAHDVDQGLTRLLDLSRRLSSKSTDDYYNPYRLFSWPGSLPDDMAWMSADLLSVHGTDVVNELSAEEVVRLAKWESVNFYSVNVYGIRELLTEVTSRMYAPGFEELTDFLHHFIGEENEHAWFFAEFCRRYGGKIYPVSTLRTFRSSDRETEDFLVFAKILIFEEIVDHFNEHMAKDAALPEMVREINRIHHRDESRHIAFGRQLVEALYHRVRERAAGEHLAELELYLQRYMRWCVNSLYNPMMYRDAGFPDPLEFRRRVMGSPERQKVERKFLRRPLSFLTRAGIVKDELVPDA